MSSPTQTLLDQLQGVKPITGGYQARCPAHEDDHASLSVSEGVDGAALLFCHAGCTPDAVLDAINLKRSDLFPPRPPKTKKPARRIVATYPYRDETGETLYESVRFEPKDFVQRRPDGAGGWTWKVGDVRRVLYRLPELQRQPVAWIVEGERDAETLAGIGLAGTTNVAGAGKWRAEYTDQLKKAGVTKVVILPDNDAPGAKHAHVVARACLRAGFTVKVKALDGLPEHGDVSDWLAMGYTKDELLAIVKATPLYQEDGTIDVPSVSPQSAVAADCFHLTEQGAAEFFADRHRGDLRYDHLRQRWLVWMGHRWMPDADAKVHRLAGEHLRRWQREAMDIPDRERRQRIIEFALRLERRSGLENMLAMTKPIPPITSTGKEWDRDPWLLGVANGVVDLKTGQYREGQPVDAITMATSAEFNPDATCAYWDAFLASILPDEELRAFLQVFVGYSLTGSTDEQVLAMLYGKGSNGKSTMLSVLTNVLGDYAKTIAFSALEFKKSDVPSDIAALQHVRFVMASEVKEGQRLNEARIKSLTGGDMVAARYLYSEWFQFKPEAKFFLAVNHKPMVADDSYGFWRRIRLVPFTQAFTGAARIGNMQEQLLAERDGILRWAIEGCLRWQIEGLATPQAVSAASDEYQAESDPLTEFVGEICDEDEYGETKASTAYSTYVKWAELRRTPKDSILRPQAFGMRFADKYTRVRRSNGMVYQGVKLASDRLF